MCFLSFIFADTLKPGELVIVKAMKNPPAGVKLVMEGVCVMLEKAPERKIDPSTQKPILDYWPTSVRLLADMDFRKVSSSLPFERRTICLLSEELTKLRQR